MNKSELEYYSRRFGLVVVIVFAVVLFLTPLLMRTVKGSPITPGAESYHYQRAADIIASGNINYDALHDIRYPLTPAAMLLFVMTIFGVPWLVPILLMVLLLVLLHQYLMKFVAARSVIITTLLCIIVSPTASVFATHHSSILLAVIFALLALILVENSIMWSYACVCFAIITDPVIGVCAVAGIVVARWTRKDRRAIFIGVFILALGAAWYLLWTGSVPRITELIVLRADFLFEIGANAGISIFFIIFAVYGGIIMAGKNNQVIFAAAGCLVASIIFPSLTLPAVVGISLLAARAIVYLLTEQWDLELLQQSLLLLIGCVGLFLVITTVRDRVNESPSQQFSHLMIELRNQYREGAILTAPEYAPVVEYYSGRRAVLSGTDAAALQTAFYSRDPTVVYPFLTDSNAGYIIITREMRSSMFTRSDEGILFLLENSGRFVKMQTSDELEVWYFIRTPQR